MILIKMNYITTFFSSFAGIFYIIIFILVYISFLNKNKILDIVSSILIILYALFFLGLRNVYSGTDTEGYVLQFLAIHKDGKVINWDYLFTAFTYLISVLGNKYVFIAMNVIIQLIFIWIITNLLGLKNKSVVLLGYISIMPGFDMLTNGLRQGFSGAIIFLIFCLAYYKNKLPKVSTFLVLILHKSTLSYLIFYFFHRLIKNKINFRLFNIIFFIIIFQIILWHLFDFRNILSFYFATLNIPLVDSVFNVGEKLNTYLLNDSEMLVGIFKYYFLVIMMYFLINFYVYKNSISDWKSNYKILNIWLLVFFLSLIYSTMWITPFSYRFMYPMFLPGLIATILSIDITNKKSSKIVFMGMLFVSAILIYGSNKFSNFEFIY